jgi:hypothetical protein
LPLLLPCSDHLLVLFLLQENCSYSSIAIEAKIIEELHQEEAFTKSVQNIQGIYFML